MGSDDGQYTVEVVQHFIVPEAEDLVAFAIQEASALGVVFTSDRVLTAVDLDDQPGPVRGEIRVVGAERHLEAKLRLAKMLAQRIPETPFRLGHRPPQGARPRHGLRLQARRGAQAHHHPSATNTI
jgi:hypothetical protein